MRAGKHSEAEECFRETTRLAPDKAPHWWQARWA